MVYSSKNRFEAVINIHYIIVYSHRPISMWGNWGDRELEDNG